MRNVRWCGFEASRKASALRAGAGHALLWSPARSFWQQHRLESRRWLTARSVANATGSLRVRPSAGANWRGASSTAAADFSAPTRRPRDLRSGPAPASSQEQAGLPQVHVLACATEYRQETAILQRSATRNGFHFHAVGVGEPWRGFATKFLAYDRALRWLVGREAAPEDMVLLTDAWDTVILGSSRELLEKTADLPPEAVLCGAEKVCGPNHFLVGDMERLYPDGSTPWRYPNSGGLFGRAAAVANLLEALVAEGSEPGEALEESENDQVHLHNFLLTRAATGAKFPLRLDTRCDVFQCMYEEQPMWDVVLDGPAGAAVPRIENRLTQSRPVVAHGNGHTGRWFLSALYSEAKLLQHLGLTMQELAHLRHEMPVAPGTQVTDEVKEKYCPWWYTPELHRGPTDGFQAFYTIRDLARKGRI